MTWNVGGLQTNPLEFWQKTGSQVRNIQEKLDSALLASGDIPITSLVNADMVNAWSISEPLFQYFSNHSVRSVLTDPEIGKKRFVSLSDRVLREYGSYGSRPSLVNGYSPADFESWWRDYRAFMNVAQPIRSKIIKPLNSEKYGDVGLTEFEKRHYVDLSCLFLICFDAALIHIALKAGYNAVASVDNDLKFTTINQLISERDCDIVFLQEVDASRIPTISGHSYEIITPPHSSGKQDSVILLRKDTFTSLKPIDVSAISVTAPGDLVVVEATHISSGRKILLASFHGDTNGLSTIPVLKSLASLHQTVIVGSDTNAHFSGRDKLLISDFHQALRETGLIAVNVDSPTTRSCRTFFQAQSHKGRHSDAVKYESDPKDNIIVSSNMNQRFKRIDFTPEGGDDGSPIPSAEFPSDHAIVIAHLDFDFRSDL